MVVETTRKWKNGNHVIFKIISYTVAYHTICCRPNIRRQSSVSFSHLVKIWPIALISQPIQHKYSENAEIKMHVKYHAKVIRDTSTRITSLTCNQ